MISIFVNDNTFNLSLLDSTNDWTSYIYSKTNVIYDIYIIDPQSPYLKDYILARDIYVDTLENSIIFGYNSGISCSTLIAKLNKRNEFFNEYLVSYYIFNLINRGIISQTFVSDCSKYIINLEGYESNYIRINIDRLRLIEQNLLNLYNILNYNVDIFMFNPKCNKHDLSIFVKFKSLDFSYIQYIFDKSSADKYIPYIKLNSGPVKIYHSYVINNINKLIKSLDRKYSEISGDIIFLYQNHSEDIMGKVYNLGSMSSGKSKIEIKSKDFVNVYHTFQNISNAFKISLDKFTGIERSNIGVKFNVDLGTNIVFNKYFAIMVIDSFMKNYQIEYIKDESQSLKFKYDNMIFEINFITSKISFYDSYIIYDNIQYAGLRNVDSTNNILSVYVKNIKSYYHVPKAFTLIHILSKYYIKYYIEDNNKFINIISNELSNITPTIQQEKLSRIGRDKLYLSGKMGINSKSTNDTKPGFGTKEQYDRMSPNSRKHYQFEFLGKIYDEYIFCIFPNRCILSEKSSRISFFFEDISLPRCYITLNTKKKVKRSISTKKNILYEYILREVPKTIKGICDVLFPNSNTARYIMGNKAGLRNFIYSIATTKIINQNYYTFMNSNDLDILIENEVESIIEILKRNEYGINPLKYLNQTVFDQIIKSDDLYIDPVGFLDYVQICLNINIILIEQVGGEIKQMKGFTFENIEVGNYEHKMLIFLRQSNSESKGDKDIYRCESLILENNEEYLQIYEYLSDIFNNDNNTSHYKIKSDYNIRKIPEISPQIETDNFIISHNDTIIKIRDIFISIICWGFAKIVTSMDNITSLRDTENFRANMINYYIDNYFETRNDNISDDVFYGKLLGMEFIRKSGSFQELCINYFGSNKIPISENLYRNNLYAVIYMTTKDFDIYTWSLRKIKYDIFVGKFYLSIKDYNVNYLKDNILLSGSSDLNNIMRFILSNKIIIDVEDMADYIFPFYTIDDKYNLYKVENVMLDKHKYKTKEDVERFILSYAGKRYFMHINHIKQFGFKHIEGYDDIETQLYIEYSRVGVRKYGMITPV